MSPSATAITVAGLEALVTDVWQLPEPQRRRLRQALRTAPCARAVTVRQQLALVGVLDLDAAFAKVLTPTFIVDMLADLGAMGLLTLGDIHRIEDCILRCVDAQGHWLSYDAYKERP